MISVWLVVTSRLQFEDNISRKLEGLCALQSILQYATISFHILQFEENISGKLQGLLPSHFTPSAKRPPAFYHALSLHNILHIIHKYKELPQKMQTLFTSTNRLEDTV